MENKLHQPLLMQKPKAIWLTGLSGSGKTTISLGANNLLKEMGFMIFILDGDIARNGISNNLGFSEEDRTENIRRIAEVSKLSLSSGIITINAFISPTVKIREMARNIIGQDDFLEVYINSSIEVCEKRDIKGLYQQAREGKIKNFTGIDSPYEPPQKPFLEIRTDILSIEESIDRLISSLLPLINF